MLSIITNTQAMCKAMPAFIKMAFGVSQWAIFNLEQLKAFMANLQGDCMTSFGIFVKLLNGRNFAVYKKGGK